ncbi:GSCFA domain-containing protein [Runella zeae]|uniref:GSCFA domain-containing protein n=1 Tax=Runella zeae TaxID=94255 RepID=UPI0003F5496B|nr:GSCFA domain-containing protein [Runella zeae]
MDFRTTLNLTSSPHSITHSTAILTIGSCFADVIGSRLYHNKLPTLVNPYGTIFNPISISKLLKQALQKQVPQEGLYVLQQESWFHYDFHSSIWATSKTQLQNFTQQRLHEVYQWLHQTDVLIITLGTAYVYRHLETGQIVANCHKTPGKFFKKELLGVDTCTNELTELLEQIRVVRPNIRVILTVSPVRHTRDTLPLNAVSKSVLRLTCHCLSEALNYVDYFPAYELLLDDLRDYRFYKSDLIHPSEVAETYIFNQFSDVYFSEDLKKFVLEWQKIQQALAHRPLQPNTSAHRQFLEKLLEKLTSLSSQIDVQTEIAHVEEQLLNFAAN